MEKLTNWIGIFGVMVLGAETGAQAAIVYTEGLQMKIQNDAAPSVVGNEAQGYFIDGGGAAAGDAAHAYDFIRFDNIFGDALGQIPAGATILDASLAMFTAVRSNAQSPGPFGVAPLLAPFALSNVYADYSGPGAGLDAGPSFINGHTGRAAGGFSGLVQGTSFAADVTLILQQWAAAPSTAFGFAIQPRTTDGWFPETLGSSNVDNRPKLTVNFTTEPTKTTRFQQDVNGYTGFTSALLDENNTTTDGSALTSATFLDGKNTVDSRDVQALLRFDALFGELEGQIRPDENILRAYVVLTGGNSAEAHSNGTFDIHQMLVPWDSTKLYTDFGGDGPTIEQGEVGDVLGTIRGMTQRSESLFDITAAVRAWQNGDENFGLNIQSNTPDGWSMFFGGAGDPNIRPELVVITGVPEPGSVALLGIAAGLLGLRRRRA